MPSKQSRRHHPSRLKLVRRVLHAYIITPSIISFYENALQYRLEQLELPWWRVQVYWNSSKWAEYSERDTSVPTFRIKILREKMCGTFVTKSYAERIRHNTPHMIEDARTRLRWNMPQHPTQLRVWRGTHLISMWVFTRPQPLSASHRASTPSYSNQIVLPPLVSASIPAHTTNSALVNPFVSDICGRKSVVGRSRSKGN